MAAADDDAGNQPVKSPDKLGPCIGMRAFSALLHQLVNRHGLIVHKGRLVEFYMIRVKCKVPKKEISPPARSYLTTQTFGQVDRHCSCSPLIRWKEIT